MSKPRITTLMEDTLCGSGLEAEHGLSLYIETKKHKILADTGQHKNMDKCQRKKNRYHKSGYRFLKSWAL